MFELLVWNIIKMFWNNGWSCTIQTFPGCVRRCIFSWPDAVCCSASTSCLKRSISSSFIKAMDRSQRLPKQQTEARNELPGLHWLLRLKLPRGVRLPAASLLRTNRTAWRPWSCWDRRSVPGDIRKQLEIQSARRKLDQGNPAERSVSERRTCPKDPTDPTLLLQAQGTANWAVAYDPHSRKNGSKNVYNVLN